MRAHHAQTVLQVHTSVFIILRSTLHHHCCVTVFATASCYAVLSQTGGGGPPQRQRRVHLRQRLKDQMISCTKCQRKFIPSVTKPPLAHADGGRVCSKKCKVRFMFPVSVYTCQTLDRTGLLPTFLRQLLAPSARSALCIYFIDHKPVDTRTEYVCNIPDSQVALSCQKSSDRDHNLDHCDHIRKVHTQISCSQKLIQLSCLCSSEITTTMRQVQSTVCSSSPQSSCLRRKW
jgi:hypothetical protein